MSESPQLSFPSAGTAVMAAVFAASVGFLVSLPMTAVTKPAMRSIYTNYNSALGIANIVVNLIADLVTIAILVVLVSITTEPRKKMMQVALVLFIGYVGVEFSIGVFRAAGALLFGINRFGGPGPYIAFFALPIILAVALFFVAAHRTAP